MAEEPFHHCSLPVLPRRPLRLMGWHQNYSHQLGWCICDRILHRWNLHAMDRLYLPDGSDVREPHSSSNVE